MKVESSSPESYIGSVAGGPQKAAERPPAGSEAPVAGATPPAPPTPPASGVTVTLSSSASQAMSGSGGGEVFNAEKVQAMKQAISDGSFKVNAEAIADKMLSNAAEMLSASSGGSRG